MIPGLQQSFQCRINCSRAIIGKHNILLRAMKKAAQAVPHGKDLFCRLHRLPIAATPTVIRILTIGPVHRLQHGKRLGIGSGRIV